jgi:cob(I)alamin adenosyltransferase
MEKKQYVQKNAADNTLVVLDDHTAITGTVPAMGDVIADIRERMTRIGTYVEIQERDRRGLTEEKNEARAKLVDVTMTVCGQLKSFGRRSGDADVRQRAAEPRSAWMKIPQSKLGERAKAILGLAREHRAALTPFGTTDALLETMEAEIATFEAALLVPRDLINRRKTITSLIAAEMKEVCTVLREELDPLMRQFEATHPRFYADYHNARALVDLPVIPRARRQASRQAAKQRRAAAPKANPDRQTDVTTANGATVLSA